MNQLDVHRKKLKKKETDAKKNIPKESITEALVLEETDINVIKAYAKKFGLKNIPLYNAKSINTLKNELIKVMRTPVKVIPLPKVDIISDDIQAIINAPFEEIEDVNEDVNEDTIKKESLINEQFNNIDRFLKSYANQKKINIFGEVCEIFLQDWNTLNSIKHSLFVRDYITLNIGDKKINPVAYLKMWIKDNNSGVMTVESLTKEYLRDYIRNRDVSSYRLNELFPHEFERLFLQQPEKQQLRFASMYLHGMIGNPLDELLSFLKGKNKDFVHTLETKRIYLEGEDKVFQDTQNIQKEERNKCLLRLLTLDIQIKPIILPDLYIGPSRGDYYAATPEFYTLLCENEYTITKDIIYIQSKIKYSAYIKSSLNTYELNKQILNAQKNNTFKKLEPNWVLSLPLNQVNNEFIYAPLRILSSKEFDLYSMFNRYIQGIVKEHRDSLLLYYTKILMTFSPFIPEIMEKNPSVLLKLKKGYISPVAFLNMSLRDKLPEIKNIEEILQKVAVPYAAFFVMTVSNKKNIPRVLTNIASFSTETKLVFHPPEATKDNYKKYLSREYGFVKGDVNEFLRDKSKMTYDEYKNANKYPAIILKSDEQLMEDFNKIEKNITTQQMIYATQNDSDKDKLIIMGNFAKFKEQYKKEQTLRSINEYNDVMYETLRNKAIPSFNDYVKLNDFFSGNFEGYKKFIDDPTLNFAAYDKVEVKTSTEGFQSLHELCPELKGWDVEDIIIHNDKCYTIPQILNSTTNEFEDIKTIYNHLSSEKFSNHGGESTSKSMEDIYTQELQFTSEYIREFKKRFKKLTIDLSKINVNKTEKILVEKIFDTDIQKDLFNDIIEGFRTEYPDEYKTQLLYSYVKSDEYVDKIAYDIKYTRKEKIKVVNIHNFSEVFDGKYNVDTLENPLKVINDLLTLNIGSNCYHCHKKINNGVTSMINKVDGNFMRVSFCNYKCLDEKEFDHTETIDILDEKDLRHIIEEI